MKTLLALFPIAALLIAPARNFNFKDTEIVRKGRFVKQFLRYSDNLCKADDQCQPVSTESFTWNGNAFVVSGSEKKRSE